MEIVTFATHNSGYYKSLIESAKRNGFKTKVLGYGEEWKGLMDKFYKMNEYLRSQPDDKIFVFMDGFDTIVLRKERACQDAFRSLHQKGKVLVSACPATWMITYILFGGCHPKDRGEPYNALNTGMYMGYGKDLKKLFEKLEAYIQDAEENDQRMLSRCYMENQCEPCLQLDTRSEIFYNLEWEENPWVSYSRALINWGEYKAKPTNRYYLMTGDAEKPLYVEKTHTTPFFLQANMNANIDTIMTKLRLPHKTYNADYDSYSASTYRQHLKKKLVGLLVFVAHLFVCYLMVFHALISWNVGILLFILWLQVIILIQWYVIGGCFLSEYEKNLHGNDKKNYKGGSVSATAFFCEKMFGVKTEDYDVVMTYYPIFYCGLICLKIYYIVVSRCGWRKK